MIKNGKHDEFTRMHSEKSFNEAFDYKYALEESCIVAITDQKGIITYANDNFCNISKYTREELIGQDHRIINSGFHPKEFIRNLWVTIANGKVWRGEMKNKAKDGTIYWVDTTIVPFLNQEMKPYQYVAIRADITSRKKAEEELLNASRENEAILNRISDGVISVDTNWRYTFLNDAAMATHQHGKKETLGKLIWEEHPEIKGTLFWEKYQEAMNLKKVVEIENYYPPMNKWFSVKVYPSSDGLTIFYKDITENKKAEEDLEKSLKEISDYKYALDESSIVAITDQKGIIQYANDNFCKISKFTREELVGQDHRIINSGYHPKEFIRAIWTTIANGKIWKGELKNKAKDETIYWVDTTIIPFLNEEGKPYQYIAIRADITERKKAEAYLEQSLKEISDYKYALDESSIVAITDQKGIIKHVNDNFCRISKYAAEELIGQDHRIINSGHHSKEFIRDLWVTIANGKIWRGELKNRAKDNSYYWVDTTIVPFLNEHGKPYQYIAIRADITERKRVEELILANKELVFQSEEKEKRAIELTIVNRELTIRNEEKKKRAAELILANKQLALQSEEREKRAGELIIANKELIFQNEEKEKRAAELILANKELVFQSKEKEKRAGELILANKELRMQNEEKEIRTAELIKAEEQLKIANQELESFSYSISHDLRAPLRAINGYARMLEEDYYDLFDDEGKRLLDVVQENAKKMGVLIDDLLAFSRLGRKEMNKSMINMNQLVGDVIEELNKSVQSKAEIIIGDLQPVMADYKLMSQVWMNLISNSIKYSSNTPNPLIELKSEKKAGEVIYTISDNGAGFNMAYVHKLFGVFQRLHDADEFEGTGVGLALVQRIITKHGGEIKATGEVGKGAVFYFSLPV